MASYKDMVRIRNDSYFARFGSFVGDVGRHVCKGGRLRDGDAILGIEREDRFGTAKNILVIVKEIGE